MNVRQLELFVSNVLRIGVAISGLLILIGLGLFLITGDNSLQFGVSTLDWIIWGSPFLEPSHILFLGFIVLVLTPLCRVGASVIAYIYQRDWAFASITGFVLLVLVAGMVLGLG
jgi:uncharacterized membrane protein